MMMRRMRNSWRAFNQFVFRLSEWCLINFSENFQSRTTSKNMSESWKCHLCTWENQLPLVKCQMCEKPRQLTDDEDESDSDSESVTVTAILTMKTLIQMMKMMNIVPKKQRN